MTLQLALNEAAKKQGYKNWNEVENKPAYGGSSIRAVACIAAEIYAEAKAKEATSLDDTKIKYYEDKIEMLIRTSAELEKEAYNQGVRDAAESKSGINIKYKDHVSVVLTANDRDTYTSKSEEFMDFLHSVDKDLISKQSILKLLK